MAEEVKEVSNEEYDPIAEEQNQSLYEDFNDESIENDVSSVDNEIDSIIKDVNLLEYGTKVTLIDEERNLNETRIDFNFDSHYQKMPFENLQINFGSDDLPRFNCANHKLNIAVRGAISIHHEFTNILKSLNKTNAHIRRSIKLNYAFKQEKCKLRLENLTRWSTSYLMLLSVKKAYMKNMFNDDNPCSVDLATIEIYLQILKPAYILSQQFQFNHSSIADIIPSIKQLIHTYLQMDLPDSKRSLCNYLITALREKFYYELNSDVYKVIYYYILFYTKNDNNPI